MGNHDVRSLNTATTHSTSRKLDAESYLQGKLSLLQQTQVEVDGIVLLGCTLRSQAQAPMSGRTLCGLGRRVCSRLAAIRGRAKNDSFCMRRVVL
ncbi:uncharacterized protein BCR38DRAFT_447875 [Pseudomassariella vexata]|uniref:Uncharacterized protein n=1 Tax=Pseudomassariella vexata TaxID=1141098 RepID=A0A1Y2DFK2_9PEZI|nr:uncharacterized protein BCR38DRAFT_447875 [Pseudomassariella vexata]ORY58062.1 hypothetical protein BCR38DRAFT_447875 [Pseudomassariella vexata]